MDTTVTHLGAVVVAALRAADYMESTIGNYQKTIRLLDAYVATRGGEYASRQRTRTTVRSTPSTSQRWENSSSTKPGAIQPHTACDGPPPASQAPATINNVMASYT